MTSPAIILGFGLLGGYMVVFGAATLWLARLSKRGRSPFADGERLLRRPGQHLEEEFERLGDVLVDRMLIGIVLPPLAERGFAIFHDVPAVGRSGPFNLDKARAGAEWLREFLHTRLALPNLPVRALVTFPGWWVDVTGRGDVGVWNSKQLVTVIDGKAVLDPHVVTQIRAQLESLCRTVTINP